MSVSIHIYLSTNPYTHTLTLFCSYMFNPIPIYLSIFSHSVHICVYFYLYLAIYFILFIYIYF